MKLRSHSSDYQRIAQGSSRSLALYCLGSRKTQRCQEADKEQVFLDSA
jgi:hypothetical protein